MSKRYFIFDEREVTTFLKLCTILYIITLFSLMIMQLYRQFVLEQPQREWNDIAMVITVNVLVILGSVLYLTGSVNPKKIKLRYILAGYGGFVLIGFLFTIFKYTVLLGEDLTLKQVADYFWTVLVISGILVLVWGLLAYLGSRRIEKQIEQKR